MIFIPIPDPMVEEDYLQKILAASVYEVARESELDSAPKLSSRFGVPVFLKREDLQPVFSFKLRGAFNKMNTLTPSELAKGVITASAGNHAQGVALAAQRLGCTAEIVMPVTTPAIKVDAVRALGGVVVLEGDSYDEASAYALNRSAQDGLSFIHPYDDSEVIAGQGTVALEILRQHSGPIYAIFVPIGGGGLAAGVASYVKRVRPEIKVYGVEPTDAASMKAAIAAGKPVQLSDVGLFADGVAVKMAGEVTFPICRDLLDGILTVTTDEICAAIKDVYEDRRSILEPSGALALAGMKKHLDEEGPQEGAYIAVASGANMNFDRLRHVSERAEIGEHRESILGVTIPEEPGSFKRFCSILGRRNITEFNYRYADTAAAHVFVGVSVSGRDESQALIYALEEAGFRAVDLSNDEMAKLHLRHMVGGRAMGIQNERLIRFEFPERPGALTKFLDGLPEGWNISLFHYRNHGSAHGRVLAGIQVPSNETEAFNQFLNELGYVHSDESNNPAYQMFLK